MLAPVTNDERYMSVGTGHAVGFCRAANSGCTTPIARIKTNQGKIDLDLLKQQPDFKTMLEEGWDFLCLPWGVELAWPTSPDIIQRALNASNDNASDATELESMITYGECVDAGESDQMALEVSTSGNPIHADYMNVLGSLVKKYGGGAGAPRLYKLDAVAKVFGENRRFGSEFLTAIDALKFPQSKEFPHVIDAILHVNATSKKVVDGVARTLVKTDVSALASKENSLCL